MGGDASRQGADLATVLLIRNRLLVIAPTLALLFFALSPEGRQRIARWKKKFLVASETFLSGEMQAPSAECAPCAESAPAATRGTALERDCDVALERDDDAAWSGGRECVVCMDNLASCILAPCGHRALCGECAKPFVNHPCPLCREKVESVVARVFA